jgi:hypothetical protein
VHRRQHLLRLYRRAAPALQVAIGAEPATPLSWGARHWFDSRSDRCFLIFVLPR